MTGAGRHGRLSRRLRGTSVHVVVRTLGRQRGLVLRCPLRRKHAQHVRGSPGLQSVLRLDGGVRAVPEPACPTGYCKTPALYRECLELQKLGWNGACAKGWTMRSKGSKSAHPVLAALASRHGVK